MIGPQRAAPVICTVLVEVALLLALVAVGRRPELTVPVGHLGEWLREGDAATVVIALLRWVAIVGTAWLLGSTLLYLAASLSRVPTAIRAVRWSTLPAVRRAVDAACAVSVATSVAFAPAVAGAARASDPPGVSLVRDGHGDGGISGLPPDATTTTRAAPAPAAVSPPAPSASREAPAEVVIVEGDNLWALAGRHLAATSGRVIGDVPDAEIAPYWVRVCDLNRDRLASRDPDLVFPGERIVLPPTG